jgi:thioesterase superfamily protein/phosphopantetheine binding protein
MAELTTAEAAPARLSCGAVERVICEIWSGYFHRAISPYDDFFDLGGDSLAMIDIVRLARDRGLPVRSSMALRNPSPSRLAESLTVHAADARPVAVAALRVPVPRAPTWTTTTPEPIAPGDGTPLYAVHSDSHVEAERDAIASWGGTRPVMGIPLPGTRGPIPPFGTVGEIADRLLPVLDRRAEPYRLAGFGFGAVVALELARRLADRGATVAPLALVRPPALASAADRGDPLPARLAGLARRFGLGGTESLDEIHARFRQDGWYDDAVRPADLPRLQQVWVDLALAVRSAPPGRYGGPAVLVHDLADPPEVARTWSEAVPNAEAHAFDHGIDSPMAILRDEHLAAVLRTALES